MKKKEFMINDEDGLYIRMEKYTLMGNIEEKCMMMGSYI